MLNKKRVNKGSNQPYPYSETRLFYHKPSLSQYFYAQSLPVYLLLVIQFQMIKSSVGEDESPQLPAYKVIILGMTSVGKTKLLTRYKYNDYKDEGATTLVVDFTPVCKKQARYNYFDTAGQQRYRSILNLYYKGSDAAILVYSVDSFQSLEELSFYYEELQRMAPDCKIYMIGTKSDLPKTATKQMAKSKYKAARYFQTSAKTDEGVAQAFQAIQKDLLLVKTKKIANFGLDRSRYLYAKPKEKCCLAQ